MAVARLPRWISLRLKVSRLRPATPDYPWGGPGVPGELALHPYLIAMESSTLPLILVVHPQLRVAYRYAVELAELGFRTIASDDLVAAREHSSFHGIVLCGSVQWWIDFDDERTMPATVLVGGDVVGLVRAAGVTRRPESASALHIAQAMRSLLRLARHSRGRGTMPMRVSATCAVKVGRWMSLPPPGSFSDERCNVDLRPTVQ